MSQPHDDTAAGLKKQAENAKDILSKLKRSVSVKADELRKEAVLLKQYEEHLSDLEREKKRIATDVQNTKTKLGKLENEQEVLMADLSKQERIVREIESDLRHAK